MKLLVDPFAQSSKRQSTLGRAILRRARNPKDECAPDVLAMIVVIIIHICFYFLLTPVVVYRVAPSPHLVFIEYQTVHEKIAEPSSPSDPTSKFDHEMATLPSMTNSNFRHVQPESDSTKIVSQSQETAHLGGNDHTDVLTMIERWSEASRLEQKFELSPLRSRVARIPGSTSNGPVVGAGRSPRDILRMVGGIVGGPNYDPDPCPRNARNIAALATSPSENDHSALLQEIEYEHKHCRP